MSNRSVPEVGFKAGGPESLNLIMSRFDDETFAELRRLALSHRSGVAQQIRVLVKEALRNRAGVRRAA